MEKHDKFPAEARFPYGRHKITGQFETYFLTLTISGWVDLFTRLACRRIVLESLSYCQREKGLVIYGYVIMSNHIHLLASASHRSQGISAIVRDFKRHTTRRIRQWIETSTDEWRRIWIADLLFKKDAEGDASFHLWQENTNPVICHSRKFLRQKLNYIHQNPVRADIVDKAEDFKYSSARNYAGRSDGVIQVTILDFSE